VRFRAIAAGAVVVTALLPASALAGPTSVGPSFAGVYVSSAPGTDNELSVSYEPLGSGDYAHFVTDSAGVLAKGGGDYSCYQQGPNRAMCPDTTSVDGGGIGQGESFEILLRDGDDTFRFASPDSPEVYGGAGNDLLFGNLMPAPGVGHLGDYLLGGKGRDGVVGRAGPDFLSGGADKDFIDGGPGRDTLNGGGGNDKLDARDGTRDRFVACGGGHHDKALVDGKDPKPTGCEVIRRR
jgi:Ca2+-binding RTX toxin-like protein